MKTTIGIVKSDRSIEQTFNLAQEFFGILSKKRFKKGESILWITFPSKKNAREFAQALNISCIDAREKRFK